jgi:MFS family permease
MTTPSPETAEPNDKAAVTDKWRSLIAITGSVGIAGMGFGFTFPMLVLTMERWGTPETIMGLNAAMFALSALIFTPFVPRLLAAVGVMRFLVTCIFVIVICILSFKAFESLWVWFPLRFMSGAAINGIFVATEIWIAHVADDSNRGRMIGAYSTALSAGFLLGPLMLLLTGPRGWLPFAGGAALVAVAALPLLLVRGRVPKLEGASARHTLSIIRIAPSLVLAGLMFGLLEGSMFNFFPILGLRIGFTEQQAPLLIVALSAGNLCCQMPIGWLADHMNKRALLTIGSILCCVFALLLPIVADTLWLLFLVIFFFGGIAIGLYTVALAGVGERFKGAPLAAANAAIGMLYGLGALIGPTASGFAMQIWNPFGLAYALAAFSAIYAVFAGLRLYRNKA